MKRTKKWIKGTVKWTCILALFFLSGMVAQYTEQNVWVEAICKFAVSFFGWIVVAAILNLFSDDVFGNKSVVPVPGIEWKDLQIRQRIWEAADWSFLILMFRYGCQLGAGTHPTLTIWNLAVVGAFFYVVLALAKANLKNFRCPRCKRRFFKPKRHPERNGLFDPALLKWPNNCCRHCNLEIRAPVPPQVAVAAVN